MRSETLPVYDHTYFTDLNPDEGGVKNRGVGSGQRYFVDSITRKVLDKIGKSAFAGGRDEIVQLSNLDRHPLQS